MRTNGWLLLVVWGATCFLGYAGVGGYLNERAEGIDALMIPAWPSIIFIVALIIAIGLTIVWVRQAKEGQPPASGRRKFL